MISLDLVRELYAYNYWARDVQLNACRLLTEEQFVRPLGSSFTSVRDTLAHLVDNEAYYLHRWRGSSREEIICSMGASRSTDRIQSFVVQFPHLHQIENRWREIEQQVRGYLQTLTQSDLARDVTYIDSSGRRSAYSLWRLLFQVINHQTYHRGQIATMLRQLGVNAPSIDYLVGLDTQFVSNEFFGQTQKAPPKGGAF